MSVAERYKKLFNDVLKQRKDGTEIMTNEKREKAETESSEIYTIFEIFNKKIQEETNGEVSVGFSEENMFRDLTKHHYINQYPAAIESGKYKAITLTKLVGTRKENREIARLGTDPNDGYPFIITYCGRDEKAENEDSLITLLADLKLSPSTNDMISDLLKIQF